MGKQARSKAQPAAIMDPFSATPLVAEGVEVREDSRGMIQILRDAPNGRGFLARLALRFGFRRRVRVNLDEYGTIFWKQIDGRRSLRDIEAAIRRTTKQDREENEKAVIRFTGMLMMRHLIYLTASEQQEVR